MEARPLTKQSARRAVEPLGEFDDQSFGSADVAQEEGVLEVVELWNRTNPVSDDPQMTLLLGDEGDGPDEPD